MINIKKVIASALVIASIMVMNPVRANAEWKQDNTGWWYTEGNSWATGWRLIDGNWYYFYSDGYMAKSTSIDGYYLNSNGAWTNSVSFEDAKKMFDKRIDEANKMGRHCRLVYHGIILKNNNYTGEWPGDDSNLSKDKFYKLIDSNEDMYYFEIPAMEHYFVGKETGRIYFFCPGNGGATLDLYEGGYLIKSWYKNKVGNQNWNGPIISEQKISF